MPPLRPVRPLELLATAALAFLCATACAEDFQGSTHQLEYEQAPVHYRDSQPDDAVSRLCARIADGSLPLRWDPDRGYLPALLEALNIPPSSQLLVFTKTSLQRRLISPETPRAIYFNDDVYVGFIPGSPVLEVSTADPALGANFYRMSQEKVAKPELVRDSECLQCHGGLRSLGVPGHVLRSVGSEANGEMISGTEVSPINHCTPIADRWAGWFVTGNLQSHRGNLVGEEALESLKTAPNPKASLPSLGEFFPTDRYPVPTSDVVAHMVLDHQAHMHNYLARLGFEARIMLHVYGHLRYLNRQVDAFLRYLLFTEEAPLTAPVNSDSPYARDFSSQGPWDSKGRSLRDFDLQTRLFKYPCSFLIYSEAFEKLPPQMRELLLSKLLKILDGSLDDPQFARITPEDRSTILEILRDTLPFLPATAKPPTP